MTPLPRSAWLAGRNGEMHHLNACQQAAAAYAAIAVAGRDARAFLQGQLTADLDEMVPGHGQLAAWLDAKGRAIALLRVVPCPDDFLLMLPASQAETVMRRLRLYVLRAAVAVAPAGPVTLLTGEAGRARLESMGLLPDDTPWATALAPAGVALRPPGEPHWMLAGGAANGVGHAEDWELTEVRAGLPEVYSQTAAAFIPQMLNLERLGAVSFTKGCYPGQEIVARAHHLGQVKRRMRLFRAPGDPPPPGTSLASGPGGSVVRSARADEGCLLLAVVSEGQEAGAFALNDGRALQAASA